ncbi:PSD1 and planctomycete cytochrome C domain-containing protein [Emticicia sp. W12TSBA100-4]|uniref:PSD1 and planctomycete cytochrome C domain-containing protein n=1 Tax=Emticicia sp. W12TSBA100-4 TaxID=3160965 RepID=UPI003305CEAE
MKSIVFKAKTFFLLLLASVSLATIVWNCTSSSAVETAAIPDEVDYNFHIRPILSDRCFKCHGPDVSKQEAGLRLDTPEGAYAALKDNPKAHAIVAGSLEQSEVYQRIIAKDTSVLMPPPSSNLKLSQHEVELIAKWIKQGAKYKPHWAFIAPQKPKLPEADEDWVKNEIDNFVYAKMDEKGLKPNEEADKERLLKRVSFDLIGLPPSIEMQERFLKDNSPNAYEKIVDELLKNKHYGEKMAISWLDVARYADSHGYQDDGLRTMWPWRDWVIHAFNSNYPYSKFLTWQLAGDLLPNPSKEMLLATGFNRNHKITQEGGVIDEEYRIEYVTDRTNTFGKSFLALTFECAHCHDHKYDPISQKDYYRTFAFFNQVPEKGLFGTIDASFADPPNMKITTEDVNSILKFINKKDTAKVMVMVMKDSSKVRPTYVLNRGNYDSHGEMVGVGIPKAIMPFDTNKLEKNRLGLAKWMLDARNPLTARVYVNRLWASFFGRGIVKTLGDFGMQGELPSHPELLDWLAVDFRENDWNVKRLVKQIVMSATYRQSSTITKKHLKTDPENIFLARSTRMRFPAENVRDHVLASSGVLNEEIGGPSVKPYQPKGLWEVATSGRGTLARYVQDHESDLYRRGMYVFIKRTVPPPSMLIFDASNRDQCEVQRSRTNTPLQALVMMNDPQTMEGARVLAENLMSENTPLETKLEKAFRRIICRKPKAKELGILKQYFESEKEFFAKNAKKTDKMLSIGEFKRKEVKDKNSTAALMQTIQMIFNMEEAIVRG